jgi:solute:Na+ symporter, SSS family
MKAVYGAALILYFAILAITGLRRSGRSKNLEDFFLASRSLSPGLMALALCAAWFGATSILVSADEAFREGVSAYWIVGLPAVLTLVLFAVFFARPIHGLPSVSLSDLFELRYGRAVRHAATFLIVWYTVMLSASQMVAAGRFLSAFLGISYPLSLVVSSAIVLLYSTIGGLLAVARVDRVQFILLGTGVCVMGLSLLTRTSFAAAAALAAESGKTGYLDFFHGAGRNALILLSFTLAWTISPIAWQRIRSVGTAEKAGRGLRLAAILLALLYAAIVASGILFMPIFKGTADGRLLVSRFIAEAAGPVLGTVLFVTVIAAILSTMDAAINTGALSATRDIYQQVFPRTPDLKLVRVSRWATFAVGAAALAVAFRFQDILKTIGLASQIMAEGLFVPGIAMLFLKRRLPLAGLLSLFLGGGFCIVAFLNDTGAVHLPVPTWPHSVPLGVALSAAGFLLGAGIEASQLRAARSRGL